MQLEISNLLYKLSGTMRAHLLFLLQIVVIHATQDPFQVVKNHTLTLPNGDTVESVFDVHATDDYIYIVHGQFSSSILQLDAKTLQVVNEKEFHAIGDDGSDLEGPIFTKS